MQTALACTGLETREHHDIAETCRLEVGDTAGWKPALRVGRSAGRERRPLS